jgi:prepilin-type N-terminal cleavage/methylation domain-containing protein
MYQRTNARAFTLIEVMIVVAIIGIVSAMMLVSFSGRRQTRNLEGAVREVMATLREAQNYALSGRAGAISENNTYYGVQIAPATSYSIVASSGTIANYTLKSGVTFSSGATTVSFTLPRGEVLVGGGPLAGSYRISLTNAGSNRYLCVYSTGRIIDNGAVAACP